jgi:hypothetical protein
MNRDFVVAGLVALFTASCLYKPIRDPVVVAFWKPPVAPTLLILLALVVYLRMDMTALVLVALYLYLYNDSHVQNLEDRRVSVEREKDDERFNPRTSIDIQFAEGTVTHAPPDILGWTKDAAPLLLFPPSQDTLWSLNG